MNVNQIIRVFVCSLTFLSVMPKVWAEGVSIFPKRIVFAERERNQEVTLMNRSDKALTYRVRLQNMMMDENGRLDYQNEPNAELDSALSMIRFSPRQVEIPAGSSQIVRFMLRKKSGLPNGEYRTHIIFEYLPDEAGQDLQDLVATGNELKTKVSQFYGLSIPAIVRHGKVTADVALTKPTVQKQGAKQQLSFNIQRTGNRSVYGKITASYVPPSKKKPIVIGALQGLSIYEEIPHRSVLLPISLPDTLKELQTGGIIILNYEEDPKMVANEKQAVNAKQRFTL